MKTDRRHRRLRRIVRPMTRFARAAGDRWDAITVRRRADRLLGSAADWEIGAIQRARSGTRIARMRSRRDGHEAILKIADAEAGVRGLKRERAVLSALCALPRLGALHPLLPEVLDAGSDGRWSYIVQRALPGAAAMPRLRRPGNRILSQASVLIAGLHEATSAPRAVAASDVERWIERPIAVLRGLVIPRSGSAAARAIDRLGTELRVAVEGQTLPLGWIHGDLWPNNILVDTPSDTITGIVDWDSAEDASLAAHDQLHLVLYTRKVLHGTEIGTEICKALGPDPRWDAAEVFALSAGTGALPGPNEESRRRLGVLLYWLRLIEVNLMRQQRATRGRRWLEDNVRAVLGCL